MKNHDIEAYINGELTGDALKSFELEMNQNADFRQEVEAYRTIIDNLDMQFLREQVTSALATVDNQSDTSSTTQASKKKYRKFLFYFLLVLIAPSIWLVFSNRSPAPLPDSSENLPVMELKEEPQTKSPENEQEPTDSKIKTTDAKKTSNQSPSKKRPIASNENTPTIPNITPPPNIRGEDLKSEKWNALLDSIWQSSFPPEGLQFAESYQKSANLLQEKDFTMAYVQLQILERQMPENDTFLFLKGYCLTELREGVEALRYFDKMSSEPTDWKGHLEWYRGFDNLLKGDVKKAVELFNKIKEDKKHPFNKQSDKALDLIYKY